MPLQEKSKRFVIYTRCSTDDQARGDFTTLDAQAHHCKLMLKALGYDCIRVIKDDGYSGKDLKRPGIQSVLKEIGIEGSRRTFDGVIFFRLDRLTRNPRDLYSLIDLFNKNEVTFLSVRENLDSSSAMGRVVIGIIGLLSAFERELTGERVRASALARVRQGIRPGGRLPYGYILINNGSPLPDGRQPHKIIIDKKTGPGLRHIWKLAGENKSLLMIGKELEQMGIKNPKGISWRKQSLLQILRNPFYKGINQWDGETHKGDHPMLVDPQLWDKANKIMGAKLPGHRFAAKPKTYAYLLEGLLTCGKCGSRYSTTDCVGSSKKHFHYYRCGRMGLGCDVPMMPAQAFDQAVVKYFKDSSRDQKIILRALTEAVQDAKNKLSRLNKDLHKTEKEIEGFKEESSRMLDLAVKGTVSKGTTFKARMEDIETKIAALEDKKDKMLAQKRAAEMTTASSDYVNENLKFLMDRFDQCTPEAQKAMIQALVKEIQIFDDPVKHIKLTLSIGRTLKENLPKGILNDMSHKEKRPTLSNGALTGDVDSLHQRHYWLPPEDSNFRPGG